MINFLKMISEEEINLKAKKIKLVLTDCDGVMTDGGVFYGENGEVMKRFNIRDGMGVERLRNLTGVETGFITGELSPSVARRAEKLKITELHLGIKDKPAVLREIFGTKTVGCFRNSLHRRRHQRRRNHANGRACCLPC